MSLPRLELNLFDNSILLNFAFYVLLTATCLLLSKSYIVSIVRAIPIKENSQYFFFFSLIQSLICMFSFLLLNFLLAGGSSSLIVPVTSTYALLCFSVTLTLLSHPLQGSSSLSSDSFSKMMVLTLLTGISSILTIFNAPFVLHLALLLVSLAIVCFHLRPQSTFDTENVSFYSGLNSMNTILSRVIFPLEVIFENIFVMSEHRYKPYSLHIYSKLSISTIFLSLISMSYFKIDYTLDNVLFAVSFAGMAALALSAVCFKFGFGWHIRVYSILAISVVLLYIFDLSQIVSRNISNILSISSVNVSSLILGYMLAIPTICIQKHFIYVGNGKRSLISQFYHSLLCISMTNTINSYFNYGIEQPSFLKTSFAGIFILQLLTIINLMQNTWIKSNSLTYLGIFSCIQDALIIIKTSFS